jgi:hypothetical protein
VQVSVPVAQLPFIAIPEVSSTDPQGSRALVHNEAAGSDAVREGYVLRLHGAVDPRGRMAQLFVAVDDPLGRHEPIGERPLPLLLGTNVRIEIEGRALSDVVVLPRRALQTDGSVWTLGAENRLQRHEVEVVWREAGVVVVTDGLVAGDRVVTTPLAVATEGMKVELARE